MRAYVFENTARIDVMLIHDDGLRVTTWSPEDDDVSHIESLLIESARIQSSARPQSIPQGYRASLREVSIKAKAYICTLLGVATVPGCKVAYATDQEAHYRADTLSIVLPRPPALFLPTIIGHEMAHHVERSVRKRMLARTKSDLASYRLIEQLGARGRQEEGILDLRADVVRSFRLHLEGCRLAGLLAEGIATYAGARFSEHYADADNNLFTVIGNIHPSLHLWRAYLAVCTELGHTADSSLMPDGCDASHVPGFLDHQAYSTYQVFRWCTENDPTALLARIYTAPMTQDRLRLQMRAS